MRNSRNNLEKKEKNMKKKMDIYLENKLREKAVALSAEKGLSYDDALSIIKTDQERADAAISLLSGRKSRSYQKRRAKMTAKARDREANQFGVALTPGTPPMQGGAPGLGKRR